MLAQRGNILFLILLAIILFVALSYAVTSGMRGGGNDASGESAKSRAASVLQWLSMLENTVGRMTLSGGVSDYGINFFKAGVSNYAIYGGNDNSNCTTANCRVFDPAGGGMGSLTDGLYKRAGAAVDKPYIEYRPLANLGTGENELLIELLGVDWNVCQEINAAMGITSMPYGYLAPNSLGGATQPYATGSFSVGTIPPNTPVWGGPGSLTEKRTFCYCQQATRALCEADQWNPRVIHVLMVK